MKKILLIVSFIIIGIRIIPIYAQHSDTLHPVDDVWIKTFGGGEGKNTFMKFDISPIPAHADVSSAILEVYVAFKAASWDSDCKFMNVNSQTWVESDFENTLWGFLRTDTVQQLMGFGSAVGWTSSADIKQIFYRDYNQSNSFCTIMLKDPDDMTSAPMPGNNPAKDSNDSLITGNIFNDYIIYPPHEFVNQNYIPRFIINYGIDPFITTQPVNATVCEGGSVTFNITATGDPTLTYQWQKNSLNINGATLNTYIINPVLLASAGNYTCIVTNAFGTDTSDIAVLSVNPAINVDAGNPQTICPGNCVILGGSPTASGGTPSYSYVWNSNPPGFFSTLQNPIVCPVVTTTYCLTVTDAAGCSATDCVTITVDPEITVTFSTTDPSFCGGCDGTITVNVSGGTPGYSYIWSNMETGQTATLLCAGSYCVTVTDFYGCTENACATLNDPATLIVSLISSDADDTICSGDCITFTDTTSGIVSNVFYVNSVPVQSGAPNIFTTCSLNDGDVVIVQGTDAIGCSAFSNSITVTVLDNPTVVSIVSPDTICPGDCSTITASASGGCAPYFYMWPTGDVSPITTICPPITTSYILTVIDCNGCEVIDTVEIFVDPCPGITEYDDEINIHISPNPFSNSAEITSGKYFNDAELKVYDILGNQVKYINNISGNTIYIERSGMRKGMYFYKISEKNIMIASGKFIVN